MKTAWLLTLLLTSPGGERERGLLLYRDGKYAEAAVAFRAAIEHDGESAELQWNLALASWRAGDLATAETAAEKYAALTKDARTDLHAGLLGAVRHDEAKLMEAKADAVATTPPAPDAASPPEDPLPLLEQALQKATAARDHFVRGAEAKATPELLRNLERSLRTIDELQQKIDELTKQREQQQDDKKEDKQDEDKKDDKQEQKPGDDKSEKDGEQDGEKPKPEPKPGDKSNEPKPDEKNQNGGEEKPEPKPQDGKAKDGKPQDSESKPEPTGPPEPGKEGEQKPEPKPAEPRKDAPGENAEGKELTSEQAQRLLEQLRELDDKQKAIRARAKSGRRAVERDW